MDEVNINLNGETLSYFGKGAHASTPYKGESAFLKALYDLKDRYNDINKIYGDFNDYLGSGLGINFYEKSLKELTMNIGKVELRNHNLVMTLDIRFPLGITPLKMKEEIEKRGYKCKILMEENPIYMDENSYLVKSLINSYNYFIDGDNTFGYNINTLNTSHCGNIVVFKVK